MSNSLQQDGGLHVILFPCHFMSSLSGYFQQQVLKFYKQSCEDCLLYCLTATNMTDLAKATIQMLLFQITAQILH